MRVIINGIEYNINTTHKYATVVSDQNIQQNIICIPEIVNGYPVKYVDPFAFRDNAYLRIIELPNSIVKIKTSAFTNCPGLKSVYFYPTDIAVGTLIIDDHAFWNCCSLKEFIVGDEIQIGCGIESFKGCRNLEKIVGQLFFLDTKSFENCFHLDNLVFAPNTWWKTETFKGCTILKNLTFLGDVEELLSNTCMKWLSHRNLKCKRNTSLADLIYSGTKIEFID